MSKLLSQKTASKAKLSTPLLTDVYLRTHLFSQLDHACTRPVIWIESGAGSGKTTLVASYLQKKKVKPLWYQIDGQDSDLASFYYFLGMGAKALLQRKKPLQQLTQEYQMGLSVFTRNYFRKLFTLMQTPGAIVFDNFHAISDDSPLVNILPVILAEIPAGINVFIISRHSPPSPLARLIVNKQLTLFSWDKIKLTPKECLDLSCRHIPDRTSAERFAEKAYTLTEGWIAGFVLMLEQAQNTESNAEPDEAINSGNFMNQYVSSIFNTFNLEQRKSLVAASLLSEITRDMQNVLGKPTFDILDKLASRNFFTYRQANDGYTFHALFRDFLLDQTTKLYTPDEIRNLRLNYTEHHLQSGNIEAAAITLTELNEWDAFCELIVNNAQTMTLQGRSQTLLNWINCVPEKIRNNNPWLSYWTGICLLPINQHDSREFLVAALKQFEISNIHKPILMACAAIIDSFLIEWNTYRDLSKWLEYFSNYIKEYSPPECEELTRCQLNYLTGLMYTENDFSLLDKLIPELASGHSPFAPGLYMQTASLIFGAIWMYKIKHAKILLRKYEQQIETNKGNPQCLILCKLLKALQAYFTSSPEATVTEAKSGLVLGNKHGIYTFENVLASVYIIGLLCVGNIIEAREAADRYFSSIQGQGAKTALYYYCLGAVALHENKLDDAMDKMSKMLEFSSTSTFPFGDAMNNIAYALLLARQGDTDSAMATLARIQENNKSMSSPVVQFYYHQAHANIGLLIKDEEKTIKALKKAFAVAREDGRFTLPSWQLRSDASKLANIALQHGIETETVCEIITRYRLEAPENNVSDIWPYQVKIFTCSRFGLITGNKVITNKTPAKPLALLKALIANGGRNVYQRQISAQLWPDSTDDARRKLFDTALFRLRKAISCDNIIQMQNGKISINEQLVWIDVWKLEEQIRIINDHLDHESNANISHIMNKIWELYRNPFFINEQSASWAINRRDALHQRVIQLARKAGKHMENAKQYNSAIKCYEKALTTDPTIEDFYQRLIEIYGILGCYAEAMQTYDRCQISLKHFLNKSPSKTTTAMAEKITNNTGR